MSHTCSVRRVGLEQRAQCALAGSVEPKGLSFETSAGYWLAISISSSQAQVMLPKHKARKESRQRDYFLSNTRAKVL